MSRILNILDPTVKVPPIPKPASGPTHPPTPKEGGLIASPFSIAEDAAPTMSAIIYDLEQKRIEQRAKRNQAMKMIETANALLIEAHEMLNTLDT
jgi:hypothetical protein